MDDIILKKLENIERYSLLAAKNVLTVDDLSQLTGLSVSTIYKLTHARKIPFSKPFGKVVYFDRKEIEEWLINNRVSTEDEIAQQAQSYCQKRSYNQHPKNYDRQ